MIAGSKPTVVVTGISGNLGLRLLRLLADADYNVIGVDMASPRTDLPLRFEKVDLGRESACNELVRILRQSKARAVVHLAFVIDPLRTGVLDVNRMWQINVAGTARVMEAITEINRHDGQIDTFIFPSSVSAYGPETPGPVKENYPLGAHTLPYAIHKQECDDVVRYRADTMGDCRTYVLRPHIFAGASMENYLVSVLRGVPSGKGKRAERLRAKGKRLPLMLPNKNCEISRLQFVHVDDVARLMAYILRKPPEAGKKLEVLNVAGRGESVTIQQAAHLADAKIVHVPGRFVMRFLITMAWKLGISGVPPEALPYMVGSYTMDTTKLKNFLGADYEKVIQYTIVDALKDCFRTEQSAPTPEAVRIG